MTNFILAAENAEANAGAESSIMMIVMLVLMFVIFYFVLIRPQKKREKELKKQVEAMRVGDKILTIGGLVGVVANIKDDEVTIYTSNANTPVTFKKEAIQTIAPRNSEEQQPAKVEKKSKKEDKED